MWNDYICIVYLLFPVEATRVAVGDVDVTIGLENGEFEATQHGVEQLPARSLKRKWKYRGKRWEIEKNETDVPAHAWMSDLNADKKRNSTCSFWGSVIRSVSRRTAGRTSLCVIGSKGGMLKHLGRQATMIRVGKRKGFARGFSGTGL